MRARRTCCWFRASWWWGWDIWALVQAIKLTSVLAKAMYAYTIYSAAITPVVMAAFFWRRATREGAVACLLSGTVITVAWDSVKTHLPKVIGERDAIFPALIVSVIALVAVSLVTPPPSRKQIAHVLRIGGPEYQPGCPRIPSLFFCAPRCFNCRVAQPRPAAGAAAGFACLLISLGGCRA